MNNTLLTIEDLSIALNTSRGSVNVVDRVNLCVGEGQAVGIVGESGSGKSMTAHAIMQLLPKAARVVGGRIVFQGGDLLVKTDKQMEEVRGRQISLIFQSSRTALNPLMTVGSQIARVYRQRFGLKQRQAWQRAVEMLDSVGIQQPERRAHQFPHQFSGGMAQRVMIALAIACQPRLLIADEPTTGLDVTTEAQILDLLQELRQSQGSSMLLITHNLGVVAAYCDYVAVMHGGHIVEFGPLRAIFHHPAHPYTRGLLASIPRPDRPTLEMALDGRAPDPLSLPAEGCRFIMRCPERLPQCHQLVPRVEFGAEHQVLCHLYGDTNGCAAG
jgi:peptide/nickel transport system ATP-binding protein